MVTDSMTKYEVMDELRNDFDTEVKPYYDNVLKKRITQLIYYKAQREKATINLGWDNYSTKKRNCFKILKKGNVNGDMPEFMAEFCWRMKKCYALFFDNSTVVVFQKHSLEQYADRVLNNKGLEVEKVIKSHIMKHMDSGFHIVLPSPTHPFCIYFVVANALFLGDYEDIEGKYKNKTFNWLNTCISLKETHATQEGIMRSLANMQKCVLSLGFNPIRDKNRYLSDKGRICNIEASKENLIDFFKNYYMLYQLFLSSNMPFADLFKEEIEKDMSFLKDELNSLFINVGSLSPFGKADGFAIKGEIDYKCNTNNLKNESS